jgi:hypothetical protein
MGSNGAPWMSGKKGKQLPTASGEVDFGAVFEGVHHMAGEDGLGRLEPAYVFARMARPARQDAQINGQRGVEAEMGQASLQAVPVAGRGDDVEDGVMLGQAIVVHHGVIGDFEKGFVEDAALRVDFEEGAVGGEQAGGGIAEVAEIAGDGVHLAMGGKGLVFDAPAKIGKTGGFQRQRVH